MPGQEHSYLPMPEQDIVLMHEVKDSSNQFETTLSAFKLMAYDPISPN